MQRGERQFVRGESPDLASSFCKTPRCNMCQHHAQKRTRETKTIWYPTLRSCDTSVPSAAPHPIFTPGHSLHKILKARNSDPIGYLLVIYRGCLQAPERTASLSLLPVTDGDKARKKRGAWPHYSRPKNRMAPTRRTTNQPPSTVKLTWFGGRAVASPSTLPPSVNRVCYAGRAPHSPLPIRRAKSSCRDATDLTP
jgi:hypothetical protein